MVGKQAQPPRDAADALITGDGDLLAIERLESIPILTPEAFATRR